MTKSKWYGFLVMTLASLLVLSGVAMAQTTLTIWAVDGLELDDPHAYYVQSMVRNFTADNPDITLDWVAFGTEGAALNNRVRVALAANQGPDIFQSWGGTFMGEFARMGKLLDLTDDLADVATSEAAKSAMSYDGKVYGIAPFFAIAGLYVNEEVFEKLELEVPTTMAELEAVCEVLVANDIQPFAVGARDEWPILATYMYLVNRYGGNIFEDAVAREVRFDADPFVQAGLKIQEWSGRGFFGPTPMSEGYGDAQLLMQTGQAALQLSGSWLCGLYADANQTDQTIGFYSVPILEGGVGSATDLMGMTDVGFVATSTAASKKDAVVRFLTYAMSVEAAEKEAGRVASIPGVDPPNRLTGMASDVFTQAETIQFWWDQNLPPALTNPINLTIQSFLMQDTDVKAELGRYEILVEDELGRVQ
ncbi:MAG: extracellular solute-binding protein [Limnochordia bacterium]|nr:extracellular solute-binding protein [Limnochordia bacterium]